MVSLAVIIPTVGRVPLRSTLQSIAMQDIRPGDEVIVVSDGICRDVVAAWQEFNLPGRLIELADGPHNDSGGTPREAGMAVAKSDYILFMDDDDVYVPGAWSKIRRAITANPGRPHMFRMKFMHRADGYVIWDNPHLICGNVSSQMICVPNIPGKLGTWGKHYAGDCDFIQSTADLYGKDSIVWNPEIICLYRLKHTDMCTWTAIEGWTAGIDNFYPDALNHFNDGAVFVEIGNWLGRSTVMMGQLIKRSGKNIKLYAIDNGLGCSEAHIQQQIQDAGGNISRFLRQNLQQHGVADVVTSIVSDSVRSTRLFKDGEVDFVFIDGDHAFRSVRRDVAAWWPKVKEGGVISGHDYEKLPVRVAVDTFFMKKSIPVNKWYEYCWAVEKPKGVA